MMAEGFFILGLFLLFWGLPLILAILALVKVRNLREEVGSLRKKSLPSPADDPVAEQPAAPVPPPRPPQAQSASRPPPSPTAASSSQEPIPASSLFNELVVGGKLASFAGMGLVLIGITLLVGYAVRHSWFGAGARILLGLLAGGVCVALGHLSEVKGKQRLHVLARILTGGGAAIFYFSVFAAHGFFGLISLNLAAAGLVLSAAATLGLSVAYRSQVVAVIGVLGAFLMPAFLDEVSKNVVFLLSYIALINLPVLFLGLQRKWQVLYNLTFGFTVLHVLGLLLFEYAPHREGGLLVIFALIYFLQYATLGLLKLRHEREARGRQADIIRLLLNSLVLLVVVVVDFESMGWHNRTALTMLVISLLHVALVSVGWKQFSAFAFDNLALLIGGLTFATLALPVHLDGAWVSSGWAIEGVLLCAFAVRAKIPLLKTAAWLLGVVGLMKTLVFDVQFYSTAPTLFLNARFASGLLSAVLLGVQGWLHSRYPPDEDESATSGLSPWLLGGGLIGIFLVFTADIFWTLGPRESSAWLLTTFMTGLLLIAAALAAKFEPRLRPFTWWFSALFSGKLLLDVHVLHDLNRSSAFFRNQTFLSLLGLAVFALLISRELPRRVSGTPRRYGTTLHLVSIFSVLLVITSELLRIDSSWSQTAVTIWWGVSAMAFVVGGLIRHSRSHRLAGLALFAVTTAKVLLVDMSELSGLDRIAAFLGAGVMLLVLSYLYQRASNTLQSG